MFEKKEKRFVVLEEQSINFGGVNIIVDRVTGVHYLMTIGTGPTAITPLLDASGNIIIDKDVI